MAQPSLLIPPQRFSTGKLFAYSPQQGTPVEFSVTRGTTAFRTNVSGTLESVASGIARLDYRYAGALQSCPAWLIEPAATNLLLRSEEFNTTWTAGNVSLTANATTAPNNTLTAEKVVATAVNDFHQLDQVITIADNTNYTISVFAKKAEINWFSFACTNKAGGTYLAWFNLDTGVVGTVSAGATARISLVGNGYYRCEMSYPSQTGSATTRQRIRINSQDNQFTWLGNGTDGIFIWGAQLETGSVATSYIPTVAATATRNADVISLTGASGLIGQTEGTLYAEVNIANFSLNSRILSISDGTASNRIEILINTSSRIRILAVQAGIDQVDVSTNVNQPIGAYKIAVAYALNNYVFFVNGVQIATDTSATVPATSQINLGSAFNNGVQLNDHIRCAALYKERLTNAELAAITAL